MKLVQPLNNEGKGVRGGRGHFGDGCAYLGNRRWEVGMGHLFEGGGTAVAATPVWRAPAARNIP